MMSYKYNFEKHKEMGVKVLRNKEIMEITFSVWAPNAKEVFLIGKFNGWNENINPMENIGEGIWRCKVNNAKIGDEYKYLIIDYRGKKRYKSDPYAYMNKSTPYFGSLVYEISEYEWEDKEYMTKRKDIEYESNAINIYEVHLGSWKRKQGDGFFSYAELADDLVDYVYNMGYNYVEIMPIMEHPHEGSWGYQVTGYFSVTSRFGTPEEFMYLVDRFHQKGIGVILDWVPAHFCKDEHGLVAFDGEPVFEHEDSVISENHKWGTLNFNFEKNKVIEFLVSSAIFYFEYFHIDGIRVDAVSSIVYLDFDDREYIPNKYGNNVNLEGVKFLKTLNDEVLKRFPEVMMIAEETCTFPDTTKSVELGGLGFTHSWNLGWVHDSMSYFAKDMVDRLKHGELITFPITYTFDEEFILPLSHDEVSVEKGSAFNTLAGKDEQKFANLRAFFGYMMSQPGKKLTFMGCEFAEDRAWNSSNALSWNLLDCNKNKKFRKYIRDLNKLYLSEKSLHDESEKYGNFNWIDIEEENRGIFSYIRTGSDGSIPIIVVCNFSNFEYEDYMLEVPLKGKYKELINSDSVSYGGEGYVNGKEPISSRNGKIIIKLAPLSISYYKQIERCSDAK